MKFKELDEKMRKYEKETDRYLTKKYLVVRLDGKGFTKLTHKTLEYTAPFDENFSKRMVDSTIYLMKDSDFNVLYGYTQSDEISLLIDTEYLPFNGKERKVNTILAGTVSGYFSCLVGMPVCFDCRCIQFDTIEEVQDYFSWRQEDSRRNSLNSYCYWTLRKTGKNGRSVSKMLKNITVADKRKILKENDIDFDSVPLWQRNGTGIYKTTVLHKGFNPMTNEAVVTNRKRLFIDDELKTNDEYRDFMKQIINSQN